MSQCWFAGLTTLDIVHRIDRFPGRNEKITARDQVVAAGGPAANAAVTAAALGVDPLLITALGRGAVADLARGDLTAHGVRILDAAASHEVSVSSVLVHVESADRSVVSADGGAPVLGPADLTRYPDPAVVLLDGHHPDLQRQVAAAARAAGAVIVVDAGRWRPIFAELIPVAGVVACSADFALANVDPGDLPAALLGLGAGAVVVTAGAGPVAWTDGERSGTVSVPAVAVADTAGAGDAFHGALVVALARGADLPNAVEFAVAVASARVQTAGPRAWLRDLTR